MNGLSPGTCRVLSTDVWNGGIGDAGPARGCVKLKAETGTMVIHILRGGEQFESKTSGISEFEILSRQNKPLRKFHIDQFLLDRPISNGNEFEGAAKQDISIVQNTLVERVGAAFSANVLCLHLGKVTISTAGPVSDVFLVLVGREHPARTYSRIGFMKATMSAEDLQEWLDGSEFDEVTIH